MVTARCGQRGRRENDSKGGLGLVFAVGNPMHTFGGSVGVLPLKNMADKISSSLAKVSPTRNKECRWRVPYNHSGRQHLRTVAQKLDPEEASLRAPEIESDAGLHETLMKTSKRRQLMQCPEGGTHDTRFAQEIKCRRTHNSYYESLSKWHELPISTALRLYHTVPPSSNYSAPAASRNVELCILRIVWRPTYTSKLSCYP